MGLRPPFDIQESQTSGGIRLSLRGALDCQSAPILEDRLARHRAVKSPVCLDLSMLDLIDSAGIRVLIQCVGDARMKRWQFQIERDLAPKVLSVFRLAHLERVVEQDVPAVP
jgi:anti-anti-sigma factor